MHPFFGFISLLLSCLCHMDFCAHEDSWWILYVRVPKYLIYFHYKKKCIKQGQIIGCVWVNFFWRCPCSYSLHIPKLRFLFLASPGIERFFFFVSLSEKQLSLLWCEHGHLTFHYFLIQTQHRLMRNSVSEF